MPTHVRFESKADITFRSLNARFTSKADIEATQIDVRFVPKADIARFFLLLISPNDPLQRQTKREGQDAIG